MLHLRANLQLSPWNQVGHLRLAAQERSSVKRSTVEFGLRNFLLLAHDNSLNYLLPSSPR